MNKAHLDASPKLLEQIVSCDWMSLTIVEAQALGIEDNLHARICFKNTHKQVWVIDGNNLSIMPWPKDSGIAIMRYSLGLEGAD